MVRSEHERRQQSSTEVEPRPENQQHLLSALRDWVLDSPTTAVPGIARSIIRFTVNVIPDPDRPDTADTLEAMRDERLVLAHAVHSAPSAHR